MLNPRHQNFEPYEDGDFALLELSQPMDISEYSSARAVCLPDVNIEDRFDSNTRFVVSGWGDFGFNKTALGTGNPIIETEKLQDVEVSLASFEDCNTFWENDVIPTTLTERQICTVDMSDGDFVGHCEGDSGGPLTWMDPQDGKIKLIGVASFSNVKKYTNPFNKTYVECIGPYSTYAKVSAVLDWVNDVFDGNVEPNMKE